MELATIDWIIMAAFFAVSLGIGIAVSRSAGKNFSSFFLAGQNMPWWLLGISMVATTFSTDTPNLVADIVRSDGTFGNWVWWAFLLTGMLTVFVYAKLWRRSGVLTDVEFYELRYTGKLASFLRAFRAVYLGVVFNVIIMASVTLAAIKIGSVLLGLTPIETVVVAASVTMLYSALGGLRGVMLTDLIQFALAMIGSIAAVFVILDLPEVGGLDGLLTHQSVVDKLDFLPDFQEMTWDVLVPVFIIPIAVQWWAAYYPGAEPGGGGYVVQRMLSAKDEKNAVWATLLFNALHYALRPWPWILVALASLIVFPDLDALAARFPQVAENVLGNDLAYPAMLTYLPQGLLGMVVASLAAAYMSTMSTQVNWGASIIVNDVYQRFLKPDATPEEQVWVGRGATVVLMVIACTLALAASNALQLFNIILQIGAGTGLLYILRWFWWRINAASELVAMIVSFGVAVILQFASDFGLTTSEQLLVGVAITTICWVLTAFVTQPTSMHKLIAFCVKVRPGGPGWKPVETKMQALGYATDESAHAALPYGILATFLGCVAIYGTLFATGYLIYGETLKGVLIAVVAGAAVGGIQRIWPKLGIGDATPA